MSLLCPCRRAPYGQPRACLHELPPARRPQAYAVLREHGRKRAPGVEPGAALMTARRRGGPASNPAKGVGVPKFIRFPSDRGGAAPDELNTRSKELQSSKGLESARVHSP